MVKFGPLTDHLRKGVDNQGQALQPLFSTSSIGWKSLFYPEVEEQERFRVHHGCSGVSRVITFPRPVSTSTCL